LEVKGVASTVLIVEDDPNTLEIVELYLRRDGHKVLMTPDGLEGLRLAREARPDLVVLDLMLPGLDGMEVCRILREESEVPIVMLTARVEEEDRLAGLDLGADDYLTKPFSPRELAARVRAVLRRTARDALERGPAELSQGDVKVDLRHHVVYIKGTQLLLTPTEFRLLALLMREPGRTFTREQIIDRVFGYDFDGFDRTVDTHVSNLRRKLEADPEKPRYIHTIYGVGYRFGNG
jgi:DNA-binding response OmpR family regulator